MSLVKNGSNEHLGIAGPIEATTTIKLTREPSGISRASTMFYYYYQEFLELKGMRLHYV